MIPHRISAPRSSLALVLLFLVSACPAISVMIGIAAPAPALAQPPDWSVLRPSNSGIPGEEIRCLRFAPDGGFWVGARWPFWQEGGIGIYDSAADVWTDYSNFETPIPSEYVNDLAFAQDGSVWIATDAGLVHKGGDTWTVYTTANAPFLHNVIREVEIDSAGRVWVNNTNVQNQNAAVLVWDGSTWRSFRVPTDIPWQDPWRQLQGLLVDRQDHVWIGNMTLPGVAEYDGQSWILRGQNIDLLVPHAADLANGVWMITGNLGYQVYRWNGSQFVLFGGTPPPLSNTTITEVAVDGSGAVFIGNWVGETVKSTNLGQAWAPFTVVSDRVTGFAFDADGAEVWIGSAGAIHRFSAGAQPIHVYNTYNTGIPDFWIDRMSTDRDGYFWLATGEAGLSRFDGLRWRNWGDHNAGSEPYPFAGNEPMGCAYQDRSGTHWFGGNGIARWDSGTGQFTGFWNWQNNPGMGVGLWIAFAEDMAGKLFSAEEYGSIYRFDEGQQRWVREPVQPYAPLGLPGMQADSHGNVWIAGWFDLYKWDGSTWSTVTLPDPNYFFDLGGISCLDIGPDGTFWIGTGGGLVRWDGTTFTLFDPSQVPLPANFVSGVDAREDGLLALAAADDQAHSGVCLIDGDPAVPSNWTVYQYGSSPLQHWQLGTVAFDGNGDLWVSCLSMGVVILRIGQSPANLAQKRSPVPGEILAVGSPTPNPFHDATSMRYSIARAAAVTFDIFDPQGRRVRRLVDAHQSAGEYVVGWTGTDEAGRPVPSGVYFGRIQSSDPAGGTRTIRIVKTE
ncbi:MAG: FlgD immunoglobulin-like domain containing protein [Candidatus Eisenbacteria bacterium]|nr:FlgD immunoglobulin-like domain containing protein [Candidatus Eisenbacteria bacterium]